MGEVLIHITEGQERFYAGDTVSGTAEVTLPIDLPISNVSVSFHCVGEVKWIENPTTPYYLDGFIYYEDVDYHVEMAKIPESAISLSNHMDHQKALLPFSFLIPKEKSLPSTMVANQGFIKYFVRVTVKYPEETKKYIKDINVQSPIDKNLMVTVGGSAEKCVLFHSGTVSMNASIGRKGFAPGEAVTVHIHVDNKTNAKVVPRITLHQVQIYMSGVRHKTIESTLTEQPITGAEIEPHTQTEALLDVKIPVDESLSIKSSLITVKYFVRVTLDIPHSLDLHINLPIVITSSKVLQQLQKGKHEQAELINL